MKTSVKLLLASLPFLLLLCNSCATNSTHPHVCEISHVNFFGSNSVTELPLVSYLSVRSQYGNLLDDLQYYTEEVQLPSDQYRGISYAAFYEAREDYAKGLLYIVYRIQYHVSFYSYKAYCLDRESTNVVLLVDVTTDYKYSLRRHATLPERVGSTTGVPSIYIVSGTGIAGTNEVKHSQEYWNSDQGRERYWRYYHRPDCVPIRNWN